MGDDEGVVATAAGLVPPFALGVPVWIGARGLVRSLPLDFGRWVAGGRRRGRWYGYGYWRSWGEFWVKRVR